MSMAKRKIAILGTERRAAQARPAVAKFDERLATLLDDMAETMYAANGAGLAAPQVSVLKRAVVIDVGQGLIELVNPEVVEREGAHVGVEGCLSVPGRCGTVERPERVKVRAVDRGGRPVEVTGEGMLAVALCHEIDHLDGVLYVDKMIEDVSDRYEQVKGEERA